MRILRMINKKIEGIKIKHGFPTPQCGDIVASFFPCQITKLFRYSQAARAPQSGHGVRIVNAISASRAAPTPKKREEEKWDPPYPLPALDFQIRSR
jgi:hypothetical protein